MAEGGVYRPQTNAPRQLAYVHPQYRRQSPHYRETFVDDGDIDMLRILRILQHNNFQGVIVPDHTPQMTCAAPWHAGMAYALGYMKAALQTIQRE
jgi:mannonate dehydratase